MLLSSIRSNLNGSSLLRSQMNRLCIRPAPLCRLLQGSGTRGRTFATTSKDPKSAEFSPLAASSQQKYRNPYVTAYPSLQTVPAEVPLKKPYERVVCIRKLVSVSAKGKNLRYDAWCLVGDRNGSASVAHATSSQSYKAVQVALKRARRTMRHYDLCEGRTLHHDIECDFHTLRLRMHKKPPGYSVKAQRNIYDVCQALGIQDLAVEIMQGTTNPVTIVRAVFHALEHHHKPAGRIATLRGKKVEELVNHG